MKPTTRRLLVLSAVVVATWLLWGTILTYPVQLFVVFVHEVGHALAAILTGGEVVGITISKNLSGRALTVGGIPFVILSAGYLTSAVVGAVLVVSAARPRQARATLMGMALLTAVCGLLFARPLLGLALPFALIVAGLFFWVARDAKEQVVRWLLIYLAACSGMYALIDIKEDLLHLGGDGRVTDAVMLAQRTGIPAIVWGALWGAISIALMGIALRRVLR